MNFLESYERKMGRMITLTKACIESHNLHGVVFAGSPGIGKSHSIENLLNQYGDQIKVTWIKGRITPMSVFNVLANNGSPNDVIVFDDADSCFQEVAALNLIKAATDHKKHRFISWISPANKGDSTIEFQGKIIIITNVILSKNPHYRAILDRLIAYDPEITLDERLAKIEAIANESEEFDPEIGRQVVKFLKDNHDRLEEISLRTYLKVAQLISSIPDEATWRDIAECTILN